jgi:uncharacterized membrane protein YfcA
MTVEQLLLVCITFVLGGVFKGAIGVGAPLIAIPVMAILVDVPFAVAVFLVPNIVSNAWQSWRFRKNKPAGRFSLKFAIFGMLGAGIGTLLLVKFSSFALTTFIALIILFYVAFKLRNPSWTLNWTLANKFVIPIGSIGGFLQGSTGLSAPVSVTFMSSVNLRREEFIFTMSLYFFVMTLIQFPVQMYLGVMNLERFAYGAVAIFPLSIGMYVGGYLGQKLSKTTFEKAIIALLLLLSLRLLASNFL